MLIDVREYPEFAAGHIAGAVLVPLGGLREASAGWDKSAAVTLICKSGKRSEQGRALLVAVGFGAVSVLAGGVDAWREAGKPLVVVEKRPWSLERQVRVVAGSLVLVTLVLAFGVSRYFLLGTAFVGAGLVFAGASDICMMATVLRWMPWNRVKV